MKSHSSYIEHTSKSGDKVKLKGNKRDTIILVTFLILFIIALTGLGYYTYTILKQSTPLNELICVEIEETKHGPYCRTLNWNSCIPPLYFEWIQGDLPLDYRQWLSTQLHYVGIAKKSTPNYEILGGFFTLEATNAQFDTYVKYYIENYLASNEEILVEIRTYFGETYSDLGEGRYFAIWVCAKGSISVDFRQSLPRNISNIEENQYYWYIPVRTADTALGWQPDEKYCSNL